MQKLGWKGCSSTLLVKFLGLNQHFMGPTMGKIIGKIPNGTTIRQTISIKSIFIIFVFLQFTLANNKIDSIFLQDLTKILIKIVFGSLSHKYMFLAIFSLLSQFEIEYIPSCSCNPSDPRTGHATKLELRKTKSCLWQTVVPENIHTPPHRSFFSLNPHPSGNSSLGVILFFKTLCFWNPLPPWNLC